MAELLQTGPADPRAFLAEALERRAAGLAPAAAAADEAPERAELERRLEGVADMLERAFAQLLRLRPADAEVLPTLARLVREGGGPSDQQAAAVAAEEEESPEPAAEAEEKAEEQEEEPQEAEAAAAAQQQQQQQRARGRRAAVSAEADGGSEAYVARVVPKSEEAKARIRAAVAQSFLFSPLDREQRETIINCMEEKRAQAGDTIIREGAVAACSWGWRAVLTSLCRRFG